MDGALYKAATEGKLGFLREEPLSRHGDYFLSRTLQNDNIIHLAARYGHSSFIQQAIEQFSIPIDQVNSKGDTPLHVSARFGHLTVVKLLVNYYKYVSSQQEVNPNSVSSQQEENPSRMEIEEELIEVMVPPLWRLTNLDGTTALHEALRHGHEDVSLFLLQLDIEMACHPNIAGESPLYLAAESRCEKVMREILESGLPYCVQGPCGQNALHAAKYCNASIINLLLRKRPELTKQVDDRGKTCLHYAIEAEYHWLILSLLNVDPSIACLPDADGLTPLLRASIMGSLVLCQSILELCPQSIEARSKSGQNLVHLFKMRESSTGKTLLKIPEVKDLLNERDDAGNTALHLAIKNCDFLKARALIDTRAIDLRVVNKEGLTSLDVCESELKVSYNQRKMWFHLRRHKAPRGRFPNQFNVPHGGPHRKYSEATTDWKHDVNTLSVMVALLFTVTFAAAFTMPGGFISSGDNLGASVLIKKIPLKIFVLFTTVAMCCSAIVLFMLMWAMAGEPEIVQPLTRMARKLLVVALYGALGSFSSGLYGVIASEELWLAIAVCIMTSIVPFVVEHKTIMGFATGIWRTFSYENPPGHPNGQKKMVNTARLS